MFHLGPEVLHGELLRPAQGCREGLVESLLVVPEEILPVGPGGRGAGIGAHALHIRFGQGEKIPEDRMEMIGDRRFRLSQALDEDDSVAIAHPLLRPEAETGLIGRDCRHGVGNALERGVPQGS